VPARDSSPAPAAAERHPGRRRVTSREELEQAAFALFERNGFDETTVDDIASAAGIGRRTFFRYFPSKNDVPWGAFDSELDRMRVTLKDFAPDVSLMEALRLALIDFNRVPADQVALHRRRMELILRVPTLFAYSTLRFTAWREVVAGFVADRTGRRPDELAPQTIAHALLGVALAAYEHWLEDEGADLGRLLDEAIRELGTAFDGTGWGTRT